HIYSRMNWGEPWYAGFRESQTEYRLKNQPYFQRNMMPAMLGWFSLQTATPVEDVEWMLARSAGFDAGYAFVVSEESLETNGRSKEILKLLGTWERARMANAFTETQKERMKDIKNEFSLKTLGDNVWELTEFSTFRFEHLSKVRQPGEPLFSTFQFTNQRDNAPMHFILTAKDATLSNIRLEMNRSADYALPVTLKSGESLRYYGGEKASVYDRNLNKTREIVLDSVFFQLGKGRQDLVFNCDFMEKKEHPTAALEVRVPGTPQTIKSPD
ncbi:MAG: hypothetical protein AAFX53_09865, partial [Bacteroidota bacterium]